ncbi:outer membrane lipoprotein chaperone LolA [Blochmannia endosymbiont of Camponotus (Colobopsis) obliquus]|uniref:outer membrane lipoprotein chaperone LolA n=1 Tax=Blochmannia endosymbiont of Camponotus (Colobopsis) obliquus TaxID=1505597 RepID=UPI00061A5C24|nr:outer membrane lipoprotein chaperone LolA [Blochmannia endosymbiont of Camponotus (Colobopsis) obliquus]AKC60544.1 Outer-membrane lipoprotein carrier protein [Blochmannia endosymbiont of Camponotus (Colobopsis) obliquus]
MNNLLMCMFFLVLVITYPVLSNPNYILQNRLKQINSFSAKFIQQVIDINGIIIQTNEGELWIKYPNFFRFRFVYPNEFFLVSNGKLLWLFNPTINQVIIYCVKNIMIDSPLILLAKDEIKNCNKYNVQQNNDYFSLLPKVHNANLKHFSITVTTDGIIKNFSLFEQGGQIVECQLSDFKKILMNDDEFYFHIPKGTTIDDQR